MIIAANPPIQAIGKKKPEKNQGFHLQPQFKYELFHMYFTSFHSSREDMNSIN